MISATRTGPDRILFEANAGAAALAAGVLWALDRALKEPDDHGVGGWERSIPQVGADPFATAAWSAVHAEPVAGERRAAFVAAVKLLNRLANGESVSVEDDAAAQVVAAAQVAITVVDTVDPKVFEQLPLQLPAPLSGEQLRLLACAVLAAAAGAAADALLDG